MSNSEENPLVMQYTELLHKHMDSGAEEVKAFREQHKDDEDFQRRANTLDKLLEMKKLLG